MTNKRSPTLPPLQLLTSPKKSDLLRELRSLQVTLLDEILRVDANYLRYCEANDVDPKGQRVRISAPGSEWAYARTKLRQTYQHLGELEDLILASEPPEEEEEEEEQR